MKIHEFEFTPENHFVAMEYYGLILNRTFLILLTNKHFIGIKANGIVSAQSEDPLTQSAVSQLVIDGDLNNPYSYLKVKYLNQIQSIDLLSDDFLVSNKSNFRFAKSEIGAARYTNSKKWGMGQYPHDGRVYVKLGSSEREFIILGSQSGKRIEELINRKAW